MDGWTSSKIVEYSNFSISWLFFRTLLITSEFLHSLHWLTYPVSKLNLRMGQIDISLPTTLLSVIPDLLADTLPLTHPPPPRSTLWQPDLVLSPANWTANTSSYNMHNERILITQKLKLWKTITEILRILVS